MEIGTAVGFRSDGFVELDKKFLPDSTTSTLNDGGIDASVGNKVEEISIVMFVQTRQENGLILWQGSPIDGEDFLSVEGAKLITVRFIC